MPFTTLFFGAVVLAGAAFYLRTLPHRTTEEANRDFWTVVAIGPLVAIVAHFVVFQIHDEAYQASIMARSTGMRANDGALRGLAIFLGFLASAGRVAWATFVSWGRSEARFAAIQQEEIRRIAREKSAAEAREQRMLEGQQNLVRLEMQRDLIAMERERARLQEDEERAEMRRQEQALLLAFKRYCMATDYNLSKPQNELRVGFRNQITSELGRRSISRLDMQVLRGSTNPEVRKILDEKPSVELTP